MFVNEFPPDSEIDRSNIYSDPIVRFENKGDKRKRRRPPVTTVERETGFSRPTIYRKIKLGEFPPGIRLGGNSVGWRLSTLRRWVAERESAV